MESTKLLQAIEQFRRQYDEPVSHMTIMRDSVLKQLASINKVEMPEILDSNQRKIFMDKIGLLEGFLKSEDGADAIELMVNAFECYCDKVESEKEKDEDD